MIRAGHGLFCCTIALLMLGVIMVNSAIMQVGGATSITMTDLLSGKYAMLAAGAIILMLIASRLPMHRLHERPDAGPILLFMLAVALILLVAPLIPGIGHSAKGASRWLRIGGFQFQPSEIIKWLGIVVLAWHAARMGPHMQRFLPGFVLPVAGIALVAAIITLNDLGTALLIAAVATALVLAGGARVMHGLPFLPLAGIGLYLALKAESFQYRMVRLHTFFGDPFRDPEGSGYQVIQSMAAVTGGGLAGHGLGNGVRKFGYLPEDYTDFIFAIICEELGIIGAAITTCLFIAMIGCMISVIRRTSDPFGRLLTLGVMMTLGLQTIINLFVVTGLAPTKGIALPLVSAGGTGWLMTAFSIGLVIAVDRHARLPAGAAAGAEDAEEADFGDELIADVDEDDAYLDDAQPA